MYPLSSGCPSQALMHYRDDSQCSDRNLPLMTHESLPKSPPLVNTCHSNGPIVFFRVLSFTLPRDFQLKWSEDNQIGIGRKPHVRRYLAMPAILSRLSPDCRRLAVVKLANGAGCYSIVVATNRTTEDLERANDLEMIQSVQRVLGRTEPPAWYRPRRT
jgi:hypothetical protein